MKAEKYYVTEFEVEGRGACPVDMLRYDQAAPADSDAARALEDSWRDGGARRFALRRIKLRMFGVSSRGPTVERWGSFLWSVVPGSVVTR